MGQTIAASFASLSSEATTTAAHTGAYDALDISTITWYPSRMEEFRVKANVFRKQVKEDSFREMLDYQSLWEWSVTHPEDFWELVAVESKMIFSVSPSKILSSTVMKPPFRFFEGAKLNFAQNILRFAFTHPNKVAMILKVENQETAEKITYKELYDRVVMLAKKLRSMGLNPGDRVGAYVANTPLTTIAMLATTAIGCVYSSCSPDFGISAVLSRFSQINPKILFASYEYEYKGKIFNVEDKIETIASGLTNCEHVILMPLRLHNSNLPSPKKRRASVVHIPNSIRIEEILRVSKKQDENENDDEQDTETEDDSNEPRFEFTQMNFNDPVYIMFSSGTTGAPKCLVQGVGVLLNHWKEQALHLSISEDDRVFYYTTTGWMMWNWLTSILFLGSTIILWEGNPCFPKEDSLWELAQNERITVFGTSAKFLSSQMEGNVVPKTYDLSAMRMILSTGSPASENVFKFVKDSVKSTIPLVSIAGGTDINGCFFLGNPMLPVRLGELQCRGLGMAVSIYNDDGMPCPIGEPGELVCTVPAPSMPLYFLNDDESNSKYMASYFERFPEVWHHGDFAELRPGGGAVIYGRSDATLKPGGVRIGTAEIYAVIERMNDVIEESLVIGQPWGEDDVRVVLFVKMRNTQISLTEDLIKKIKVKIRNEASPRHVPEVILDCPDIPFTVSGKKVEITVRKIICNEPVKNIEALKNPESLEWFRTFGREALFKGDKN